MVSQPDVLFLFTYLNKWFWGICSIFFCHRAGLITSTAKSLDILRQNIQRFINKEIDVIIQDYMEVIRTVL